MNANNLIEDSQHGFVKGRSHYLSDILERGGAAEAIFLDFAKRSTRYPKIARWKS
jgi:hypothetical protein